jgi:hypothetical protein
MASNYSAIKIENERSYFGIRQEKRKRFFLIKAGAMWRKMMNRGEGKKKKG